MKECVHIKALREYLKREQIAVWSEHGEEPAGWVNVHCLRCKQIVETSIEVKEL